MQSIIPIGEGKALRMTTAKYYTPSHRTIHENGVVPNIVATLTPTEERNLAQWFGRDTLPPAERKKVEKFRDPQLIRAVDAMKGALVYSDVEPGEPNPASVEEVVQKGKDQNAEEPVLEEASEESE